MRLIEIVNKLNLKVKCGSDCLENEVLRGYASDLMSDVMTNSKKGDIWITLQVHVNVAAVAAFGELSAIILINNREPEEQTLKKAIEEKIPILISELPAFELIGRLYELGIHGIKLNA